jgi:hypothetical protein
MTSDIVRYRGQRERHPLDLGSGRTLAGAVSQQEEDCMASIYRSAPLHVSPEQAWRFLDAYTRSEVHVFSMC